MHERHGIEVAILVEEGLELGRGRRAAPRDLQHGVRLVARVADQLPTLGEGAVHEVQRAARDAVARERLHEARGGMRTEEHDAALAAEHLAAARHERVVERAHLLRAVADRGRGGRREDGGGDFGGTGDPELEMGHGRTEEGRIAETRASSAGESKYGSVARRSLSRTTWVAAARTFGRATTPANATKRPTEGAQR